MTTVASLAAEYGMQPYELEVFSDDLIPVDTGDDYELPADVEAMLREALAAGAEDEAVRREALSADEVDRVRATARELASVRDEADRIENDLRWAIRDAIKAGARVESIADAAGLSRQRVYQIRDGRR